MKNFWILPIGFAAAAHLLLAGALAAPPQGSGMAAPGRADLVRVQATAAPEAFEDRMARLRQHRSILLNSLRPTRQAAPTEPAEPQARALRPPEPRLYTVPQEALPRSEVAGEGQGLMDCEAAAQIVAEFGFSDVRRSDCSGDLYRFSAMRDGTAYSIGITAATGEIAEVSRQ